MEALYYLTRIAGGRPSLDDNYRAILHRQALLKLDQQLLK